MSSIHNSSKSFTSKRRMSEGSLSTPGPASYNISRDLCARSISFARAKKCSSSMSMSPGPGSYNLPSMLGTGPRAVIPTGRNVSEPPIFPGPSDYSPSFVSRSIKYSFPKRQYSTKVNITPGPSDYEVCFRSSAPRATIGKAKRLLLDISNDQNFSSLKNKILPKNMKLKK